VRSSIPPPPRHVRSSTEYGPRVGIYAAPGPEYVSSTWGSWLAGGIAVPLATSHPYRELDYVIKDAGISTVRPLQIATHIWPRRCQHPASHVLARYTPGIGTIARAAAPHERRVD
jgi:acyl-CoA synthetase (AMP-forming)/AMP-acid ligase II